MDNRGFFVFAVSVFIFLIIGSVFIFALNNYHKNGRVPYIEDDSENISCANDEGCVDNDLCTLNYCDNDVCKTTNVVLCYYNDGCCPKGCTKENDNDCTK